MAQQRNHGNVSVHISVFFRIIRGFRVGMRPAGVPGAPAGAPRPGFANNNSSSLQQGSGAPRGPGMMPSSAVGLPRGAPTGPPSTGAPGGTPRPMPARPGAPPMQRPGFPSPARPTGTPGAPGQPIGTVLLHFGAMYA